MSAVVAASAMRTCLGDGEETFEALLRGTSGVGDLRHHDPVRLNVRRGYQIGEIGEIGGGEIGGEGGAEPRFQASGWLQACVREALDAAGVDPARQRVVAVVGTGLRELREVERWSTDGSELAAEQLHFAGAVRRGAPGVEEVVTLANACSAGGHALALAQDLVELGEADAVVAAGADSMTASMLAMIGRVSDDAADQVRPFDSSRGGALLGEGAAAVVVVAEAEGGPRRARLLATGLSCDAHHETAAAAGGVRRAVEDAFARAGRDPADVDLVVAHGTGTAINDPLECELLRPASADPRDAVLVTAVKGAIGHTSGAAALMSVDIAIRCIHDGVVPAIVGLQERIPEAARVGLVVDHWGPAAIDLVQVNAFGFGGVNAVTLLEAVR